jgi:hypothetical protein
MENSHFGIKPPKIVIETRYEDISEKETSNKKESECIKSEKNVPIYFLCWLEKIEEKVVQGYRDKNNTRIPYPHDRHGGNRVLHVKKN